MNDEKEWNENIQVFVGKTITSIRYMTIEEADEAGWYRRPVIINFSDGTEIVVSADDEGNEGGSLFTNIKGLETIPTLS